jgi:hypothetical protein
MVFLGVSNGQRMFMPRLSLLPLFAPLVLLALPFAAVAEEIVTTTDGRQLMLRDNGSFQFLTEQQRQIPANPYLSNTNPYLTNTDPTHSPYVVPARVPASVTDSTPTPVSRLTAPASPATPMLPQTNASEKKPEGFMGILDDLIGEKKNKKSFIRK